MSVDDLLEKYTSILQNEEALTAYVAGEVIEKPQLALWMILIPVFFVFYFFQLRRYKDGLRSFKRDFIITRQRVLEAVYQAMSVKEEVDIESLVSKGNAPKRADEAYRKWVNELILFFQSLLEAEGDDFASLVRFTYRKKSNYLLVLNKLNTVEKALNRALIPGLEVADDRTSQAVEAIERSTTTFRRNQAKELFAG